MITGQVTPKAADVARVTKKLEEAVDALKDFAWDDAKVKTE